MQRVTTKQSRCTMGKRAALAAKSNFCCMPRALRPWKSICARQARDDMPNDKPLSNGNLHFRIARLQFLLVKTPQAMSDCSTCHLLAFVKRPFSVAMCQVYTAPEKVVGASKSSPGRDKESLNIMQERSPGMKTPTSMESTLLALVCGRSKLIPLVVDSPSPARTLSND